jgi:beta-N-acetylhexosaminidase
VGEASLVARPLLRAFTGAVPPPDVLDAIRAGDVAGVALYRALNVVSPSQVRALAMAVQRAALEGGQPTAIVAIDQEGGQLQGVGPPATPFAGNMALAATGSVELAGRVAAAMGQELAAMGCNVSWAPDLDLATLATSPAVGARSFGDDPELAARMGAAIVEGLQSAGVAAAAKHFPGSGETLADPHHGLPVVDVDRTTMEARELVPFRAAVAAGARLVMVSHAAYPGLERGGGAPRPALRSSAVLRDLLRDDMGFRGVVVTDALDMAAVDQSDVAGAAVAAIEAGVDLLLAGPAQADRPGELARLLAALRTSPAAEAAAGRVAALRRWLGQWTMPPLEVVGSAEHAALARELARRSVTQIRDEAGLLPLRPSSSARLLVLAPTPADLTPADTSSLVPLRLIDAVRRRHARTETFTIPIDPSPTEVEAAMAAVMATDLVILCTIDAFRHPGQLRLAHTIAALERQAILVALRMPTDVDVLDDLPTALACYSIHDPSTEAMAAVIFGEVQPTGRVPLADTGRSRYSPVRVATGRALEDWS